MERLIQGIHHFQTRVFGTQKELFERLARHQSPDTLFIACSDSRVSPTLITSTEPGELFVLRNAGNFVPPYMQDGTGEAATIEYAVAALGVNDIVVCGHSNCGAMQALLDPGKVKHLRAVSAWLELGEPTRRIVRESYGSMTGDALLEVTIEEHVLVQLENLRSHPSVAARLEKGDLRLHGWVYWIETGEVFAFDPSAGQFVPVRPASPRLSARIKEPRAI